MAEGTLIAGTVISIVIKGKNMVTIWRAKRVTPDSKKKGSIEVAPANERAQEAGK